MVEQAREAFRRGAELAKAEHWQDAILSFEKSHELKPHPVTSYNLGFCERAMGHSTRARKLFRRAFDEHRLATEGLLPDDLIELTKRYLDEIEARLARVEVAVDRPQTRLLVDGLPLEAGADSAPVTLPVVVAGVSLAGPPEVVPATRFLVLLDPGQHSFSFSSPGRAQTVLAKTLAPGLRTSLELGAPLPQKSPPAAQARASSTRNRTWAYVALGLGAAGIATGAIAGGVALGKKSALDKDCGPSRKACPSRGEIDEMETFADVSTIGFALGAVGIGIGVGLYVWGPPASAKSATTAPSGPIAFISSPSGHARIGLELSANQLDLAGTF